MTTQMLTVLVAEDGADFLLLLDFHLRREGFRVVTARNGAETLDRLRESAVDLVMLDIMLADARALDVLKKIRAEMPEVPVIVTTADVRVPRVVEALKLGAFDVLAKPFEANTLRITIHQAAEHVRLQHHLRELRERIGDGGKGIVAESPGMQRVLRQLRQGIDSNATVLLLGESGTGKGLLAKELHRRGPRAQGPFIAVNCAAIPDHLLESELFGHEKGAFTGADASRVGKFEAAHGGMVFLDEVGEMPLPLQAKLLRVLQEREIVRVGSNKPIRLDVRVVAATNRDIAEAVRRGRFREDLYYRLAVLEVIVPPLRDRREDIPFFVDHFIRLVAGEEGKEIRGISPEAKAFLATLDYPGNVRQLENMVRRAVIFCDGDTISHHDLLPINVRRDITSNPLPQGAESQEAETKPGQAGAPTLPGFFDAAVSPGIVLNFSDEAGIPPIKAVEMAVIRRAIEVCHGNVTRAAKMLGIGRATVYRRILDATSHSPPLTSAPTPTTSEAPADVPPLGRAAKKLRRPRSTDAS